MNSELQRICEQIEYNVDLYELSDKGCHPLALKDPRQKEIGLLHLGTYVMQQKNPSLEKAVELIQLGNEMHRFRIKFYEKLLIEFGSRRESWKKIRRERLAKITSNDNSICDMLLLVADLVSAVVTDRVRQNHELCRELLEGHDLGETEEDERQELLYSISAQIVDWLELPNA